jgi:parallel beta-helix repeat protein
MAETTISVDGAAKLRAALETAGAGTTIELAPGDYGTLGINARYGDDWGRFAGEVTIRSADPANPATFDSIFMRGVENLTIDGVVVDYTAPPGLTGENFDKDFAAIVQESKNIAIRNSLFDGDVLDDPGALADGLPVAKGLFVRESENVVIEGNEFLEWYRAAGFQNTSNIEVRGNDVHTIRSDGLNFAAVQGVLVEDNYFHDFVTNEGVGDHRDMIQFWTTGTRAPSTEVTIRNNYLNSGSGADTQSIFMRNELVDTGAAGREMFYQNVVIENNVIYNAHANGIWIGETDRLTIANNTLLHNPDSGDDGGVSRPGITVAAAARNVNIAQNIAETVSSPSGSSVGWKVADNLLVQNKAPDKPNYYDEFFINSLTGGGEADLAALQALPGSIVEKAGYGAGQTRFDRTPETLTAVIRPEGVAGDTYSFAGGYTANAKGLVGDGATFRWEMGDGTVRNGVDVDHSYARPGTYKVKLTVTDAEGNTDSALAEAYVPEPVRLDLDVTARGLVDLSTYAASDLPSVRVEQGGGRYGARLTDKTGFEIDRAAPIYDLDAFAISLDLRAADGAASAGDIFRIYDNMALRVQADGSFGFDLINDAGRTFQLESAPTEALDGDWHTVSLTYENGALALALDGAEAGRVAASGSTRPADWWGLYFGSRWGKTGFDGLVDDLQIRGEGVSGQGPGGPVEAPENPVEAPEEPAPQPEPAPAPEPAPQPEPAPEPAPEPGQGGLSFGLALAYDDGRLIDADLTDGEVVALDDLDDGGVTLVATPSEEVGSVKLDLAGVAQIIENTAPYALFGDEDGVFYPGAALAAGDYQMVLTAYSGEEGGGSVLGSDTISFSVVDQVVSPQQPEAAPSPSSPSAASGVVNRWTAGPSTIAASDGGPDWVADAGAIVGATKLAAGPTAAAWTLDASVPGTTPEGIFEHERYGTSEAAGMGLEFGDGALEDGRYAVRLYMGNGWSGTDGPGERVFGVEVEDELAFEAVDLSGRFGHLVGGMLEWQGTVSDGTVDIDFLRDIENPLINGVEIVRLDDGLVA